jgi:hypothetical protein
MKPRGQPFEAGNRFGRGRPKGSRNKITLVAQRLLQEFSEPIVRKSIIDALQKDGPSRRLCMERILPAQRNGCIRLQLPRTMTAQDVDKASEQVVQAVATGRMTPADGESMLNILELRRKAIETGELQARFDKLEAFVRARGEAAPGQREQFGGTTGEEESTPEENGNGTKGES